MQVPGNTATQSTGATDIWGEKRCGPHRTLGGRTFGCSYMSGFKTPFTSECPAGMHGGSWDWQVSLAVTRASL